MKNKKNLAARILKTSPGKVRISADALEDVKKAITRSDIRGLVAVGSIKKSTANQHSRSAARVLARQKRKGRRKGRGSKKGSQHSTVTRKGKWMLKVRTQRIFLKELKEKKLLSSQNFRALYSKSKGGFFRNKRHIKLYIKEQNLIKEQNPIKET